MALVRKATVLFFFYGKTALSWIDVGVCTNYSRFLHKSQCSNLAKRKKSENNGACVTNDYCS